MVQHYYALVTAAPQGIQQRDIDREAGTIQARANNISITAVTAAYAEISRDPALMNAVGLDIGITAIDAYLDINRSVADVQAAAVNLGIQPAAGTTLELKRDAADVHASALNIGITPSTAVIKNVARDAAVIQASALNLGIQPEVAGTLDVTRSSADVTAAALNIGIQADETDVLNWARQPAYIHASALDLTLTPEVAATTDANRNPATIHAVANALGLLPLTTEGNMGGLFPPGVGAYMWRDVSGEGGWKASEQEGSVVAFIKSNDFVRSGDTIAFTIAGSNAAGTRLELGIQETGLDSYDVYIEWDSVETGAGTKGTNVGLSLNDNKWHCVVWVRDATGYKVYIDGQLYPLFGSSGDPWWGDIQQSTQFNRIAVGTTLSNGDTPSTDFYEGSLDEIFTVNRALFASEVTAITNYVAGIVKGRLIVNLQTELPALWPYVDYAFELKVGGGSNFGDEYIQNQASPGSGNDWLTVAPLSDSIQPDPSGIEG